jgi:hypothetical protein
MTQLAPDNDVALTTAGKGDLDALPVVSRRLVLRWVASALPFLLSSLALLVSFLGYRLTAVRNVKPTIILLYLKESGWHLKNIGNGPALNLLVAQRHESGGWFCPVRVPPLAQGDQTHLWWMGHTNVRWIGATYTDIDGRAYSSECSDDLTRISDGSVLPHWSEQQIRRAWQQTDAEFCQ